jgi:hypothetical protein
MMLYQKLQHFQAVQSHLKNFILEAQSSSIKFNQAQSSSIKLNQAKNINNYHHAMSARSKHIYITNLVGGQALIVNHLEDEMIDELHEAVTRSLTKESMATPNLTPSTTAASTPVSTPTNSRRSSSSRPFSYIPEDAF